MDPNNKDIRMPVTGQNLAEVIQRAWKDALERGKDDNNIDRSKDWVNSLAWQFKEHYPGKNHESGQYRVFWRGSECNKASFHVNELLFDIAVCSTSTTNSFENRPRGLEFISDCHWQIESEFNKSDSREVIIDMSKLVMGSAQNKLMIASHRGEEKPTNQEVLDQCAPIALRCTGNVYFCFISHPNEWCGESGGDPQAPALHAWTPSGWTQMSGSTCCPKKFLKRPSALTKVGAGQITVRFFFIQVQGQGNWSLGRPTQEFFERKSVPDLIKSDLES